MAITYTPVCTLVSTTGASGVNGFTGAVAAHQTAIATGVTTALAVSDLVPNSVGVGSTQFAVDTDTHLFEFVTQIKYARNISS
jgi:hypothetical protein